MSHSQPEWEVRMACGGGGWHHWCSSLQNALLTAALYFVWLMPPVDRCLDSGDIAYNQHRHKLGR